MTNKIDIVLKAITAQMAGALPRDTVKNPKLNINSTTLVLAARSYPTKDLQCSTHIHGPNKDDKGLEWLDVEEPLDLVDTIILSEDDYDRGCREPSDLEEGFYRDTIKLGLEYLTGMDDEGKDV
ncbi:hypothetical protein Tco_0800387 [Tanacetum coccineum]|uniref:Uncharacterized protein n=1 Tax=Tanacetum coccineum TaxID=301880 RepID=A0ABQ4ZSZ3_9ASTR